MTRSSIIFALIVAALLSCVWYEHRQVITLTAELEKRRREGNGELIISADSVSAMPLVVKGTPQEQAQCAAQAEHYFNSWQKSADPQIKGPYVTRSYVNHYEVATRSCFVEVTVVGVPSGKNFTTTKFVTDAYEGGDLAGYLWVSHDEKKYWEVRPVMCSVKDRDGKDLGCDSDDSFRQTVLRIYGLSE